MSADMPDIRHGDPMDMIRLLARANARPGDVHVSWMPADWDVRHRTGRVRGPAGEHVLGQLMRGGWASFVAPLDYDYRSREKRLILLDSASLRRLAAYVGFCLHAGLFRTRGPASQQIRRQARRYDEDAVAFIVERVPNAPALQMDLAAARERPHAAGRIALLRGYRLLMSFVASEGADILRRLQQKLPRCVASLRMAPLDDRQRIQLGELIFACIVPERLPRWDWLF